MWQEHGGDPNQDSVAIKDEAQGKQKDEIEETKENKDGMGLQEPECVEVVSWRHGVRSMDVQEKRWHTRWS